MANDSRIAARMLAGLRDDVETLKIDDADGDERAHHLLRVTDAAVAADAVVVEELDFTNLAYGGNYAAAYGEVYDPTELAGVSADTDRAVGTIPVTRTLAGVSADTDVAVSELDARVRALAGVSVDGDRSGDVFVDPVGGVLHVLSGLRIPPTADTYDATRWHADGALTFETDAGVRLRHRGVLTVTGGVSTPTTTATLDATRWEPDAGLTFGAGEFVRLRK